MVKRFREVHNYEKVFDFALKERSFNNVSFKYLLPRSSQHWGSHLNNWQFRKRGAKYLKRGFFQIATSPSSIFACNRIQAAPYLLRFSRRVNVREARWRIAEILISPTSRVKKEHAYSLFALASPQASWKGKWIGSRFLGWFHFSLWTRIKNLLFMRLVSSRTFTFR